NLADRRKAVALEGPENVRTEAVVAMKRVHIARLYTTAREHRLVPAERLVVKLLALIDAQPALAQHKLAGSARDPLKTLDENRRLGEISRPVRACQHDGHAGIDRNRTVKSPKRLHDVR